MAIFDEIEHANYWDCFDLTGDDRGVKLFGNANVGNAPLTNMQIGQQVTPSATLIVRRWYARTAIPELARASGRPDLADHLGAWGHMANAVLVIGSRPKWRSPLSDLFAFRPGAQSEERRADDPWPVIVPVRQTFYVQVDWGYSHAFDAIVSAFAAEEGWDRPRIWIHLDGFKIPSDKHLDKEDHETMAAVIGACMNIAKTRETTEEDIAAWIMEQAAAKDLDDTGRAMLQAIADGVLRRAGG